MAILEIHDDRGRAERVTIARDRPVTFGTNAGCDLVLYASGVLALHGRIRWIQGRYKVEVSPEAPALIRNGQRVENAGFRPGDELKIGSCRIFMIQGDEDEPAPRAPGRERTQTGGKPTGAGKAPAGVAVLERADWLKDLNRPAGVDDSDSTPAPPPTIDAAFDRAVAQAQAAAQSKPQPVKTGSGWKRRILDRVWGPETAPGQEKISKSPLVLALGLALALLVAVGLGLYVTIRASTADKQFLAAKESFDNGEYRNAIHQFGIFLKSNPDEKRAGRARVLSALADVSQFAKGGAPTWSNALKSAQSMVEEVGDLPEYQDANMDLAELVLATADGLADRARRSTDAEALAEAETAVTLHQQIAGKASEALIGRSRVPTRLEQARAAVRKAQIRAEALAEMDKALAAKDPLGAYAVRDRLVAAYVDLAQDREVVARLLKANDLLRDAVTFDASRRPAVREPRPDPLGPPVVLYQRTADVPAPPVDGTEPRTYALAQGMVFGVDGRDGRPRWASPIGEASPFPPLPVTGGALVFDPRGNELVKIDAADGRVLWRQAIGEPLRDAPLVLGDQVIAALPSGTLAVLQLSDGAWQGAWALKRPLTRGPVVDESGQFLHVLADEANLFVLRRDPPACTAVFYLGHTAGSIACTPARLGRFLVVPENHGRTDGRWRVLLLGEDGKSPTLAQTLPVPGWTWATPASSGSVVWSTDDRGGMTAYAIGSYDAKAPFAPIAARAAEAQTLGPVFARPRNERELWIASERSSRVDLNAERGDLATVWSVSEAGPALAPIQVAGHLVVLTQQAGDPGSVGLWGIDSRDGKVAWRTVLGAGWPVAPAVEGDVLTAFAPSGARVEMSASQVRDGAMIEQPFPRIGRPRLPEGRFARVTVDKRSLLAPLPPVSGDAVYLPGEGEGGTPKRVALPTPLGAVPLGWGADLLVPGIDGYAELVDPADGTSQAEPFVAPFNRETPSRWLNALPLEGDGVLLADDTGKFRRMVRTNEAGARWKVEAETALGSLPTAAPAVAGDGQAIVVTTADAKIRALAARDLAPLGAWPLDAPIVFGPSTAAGFVFLGDAAGHLLAMGPDGRRLWSAALNSPPSGPPIVRANEGMAWVLTLDGRIHHVNLADGIVRGSADLGIVPAGGLLALGDTLAVPVGPGILRAVSPSAIAPRATDAAASTRPESAPSPN